MNPAPTTRIRRTLRRSARLSLVAAGLGAALTAAPASASPSDPWLGAGTGDVAVYSQSWFAGGGTCYANASASWNRATNTVYVYARAWSTAPFAGCRVRVAVLGVVPSSSWFPPFGGIPVGGPAFDVPTACSTTDPTCPSTTYASFAQGGVFAAQWVPALDHLYLSVSSR
jgi:hypothetical protein